MLKHQCPEEDHAVVPIGGFWIKLDHEDVWRVLEHTWSSSGKSPYPFSSTVPGRTLHRFLLGDPECETIDHKNGLFWDNRKQNLRPASRSENARNARKIRRGTSRFKGVSLARRRNRTYWQASIRVDGKNTHLGYFQDEEDAARAYDTAAKSHFQDFARGNFI